MHPSWVGMHRETEQDGEWEGEVVLLSPEQKLFSHSQALWKRMTLQDNKNCS